MRRAVVVPIGVLLLVTGAVLAGGQVREPGPTHPVWEYRTEVVRGPTMQEVSEGPLNALGREGWELAVMSRREIRVQDTVQTETVLVFKRSRGDAPR